MNYIEPERITKAQLEEEFGFDVSDAEYETMDWCIVCEEWAIIFIDPDAEYINGHNVSCHCA